MKIPIDIDSEIELINDFKSGFNLSELNSKYVGSRKRLREILFKHNLIKSIEPTRRYLLLGVKNEEIRNKLISRYSEEKDILKIGEELNLPYGVIYNYLVSVGLHTSEFAHIIHNEKVRKYQLNEKYFDCVDCEEKAYFLGILYADGTNSTKQTEVLLRLNVDDIDILIKLNNLIQPTKPILLCQDNKQYKLAINSKILSLRLAELGVIPNKTFTLKYPDWLKPELNKHFIRGYFDGDGGVTYNKKNKGLQISFTGTEEIITSIRNILTEENNMGVVKLYCRFPERNNNNRTLYYSGNGNAKRFYDYIYSDSKLYMLRKKNKFEEYIKM